MVGCGSIGVIKGGLHYDGFMEHRILNLIEEGHKGHIMHRLSSHGNSWNFELYEVGSYG